jgi:hypothetical protein
MVKNVTTSRILFPDPFERRGMPCLLCPRCDLHFNAYRDGDGICVRRDPEAELLCEENRDLRAAGKTPLTLQECGSIHLAMHTAIEAGSL